MEVSEPYLLVPDPVEDLLEYDFLELEDNSFLELEYFLLEFNESNINFIFVYCYI